MRLQGVRGLEFYSKLFVVNFLVASKILVPFSTQNKTKTKTSSYSKIIATQLISRVQALFSGEIQSFASNSETIMYMIVLIALHLRSVRSLSFARAHQVPKSSAKTPSFLHYQFGSSTRTFSGISSKTFFCFKKDTKIRNK